MSGKCKNSVHQDRLNRPYQDRSGRGTQGKDRVGQVRSGKVKLELVMTDFDPRFFWKQNVFVALTFWVQR